MNIKQITDNINLEKIMKVISLNEISGNENVICKFSYAGGKSGYSFGRSQFDVKHNGVARNFLRNKCGFTAGDIERLLKLDKNIKDLNEKLKKYKKEIDELDKKHIRDMVNYVASLSGLPEFKNEKTFVHLVDYHNQFNLSKGGLMHNFIKNKKILTSQDILNFKLGLKWGREQPQDVKRRYLNIENNWN
ncbi:MAG: hypothetical protein ACLTXO_13325 [Fusobacterium varium]|uniref:hypothetical protein n=1 Tax=Fusobacterium varium TaxID=856 RepID=UPI001F487CEF|nr:hypothetical protein [Fusobacterium varium]MCF2674178.1 hypothetical protein [Fusobacterium varium]UYI78826.1 MAG: hypothetical protein OGM09_00985 [Fusobacterium varium]